MRTQRIKVLWGLGMCVASACAQQGSEGEVARASEALMLAGAAAPRPVAVSGVKLQPMAAVVTRETPEGFSDMRLALLDGSTARLSFRLGKNEQLMRKVDARAPRLTLAASPKEQPVEFNDMGKAPDRLANDGLFSGAVPIKLDALARLNDESTKLRQRTAVRFVPGSHEAIGSFELPQLPFDLEKLKSGAEISVLPIGELGPFQTLGAVSVSSINPQKSLMMTSLPIIEDTGRTMNPCDLASANSPLKPWTFGHLMEEMAVGSGLSGGDFAEAWLNTWLGSAVVAASGGSPVLDATSNAAAANVTNLVINPWRARSGGGTLDLRIAPFRLQGIFYRPDLGRVSYGSAANNAGELRFVFGLLEARDNNHDGDALDARDTCQVTEMAVIFEFGVPLSDCSSIKNFANQMVNLSTLLPGTPAYGMALESITESVVKHGAAPSKPNQNALNQLRTNEIDLTGIWQLREFVITPGNGPLMQTTTKNNPRQHAAPFTTTGLTPTPIDLSATNLWLNELTTHPLPELSLGAPFLAGSVSYNPMVWDNAALTPAQFEDRFNFSLNTCSSCHTQETSTSFYHVRPTGPGGVPSLSSFLSVSPFPVTDVHGLTHTFQEKDNRKQALANFANASCGFIGGLPPFELLRLPMLSVH
jgi:hypothetical protein